MNTIWLAIPTNNIRLVKRYGRNLEYKLYYFNPKKTGESNQSPSGFSKNVFFKERARPCFVVTFIIIISDMFPENLIEIAQVVLKIRRFSLIFRTF